MAAHYLCAGPYTPLPQQAMLQKGLLHLLGRHSTAWMLFRGGASRGERLHGRPSWLWAVLSNRGAGQQAGSGARESVIGFRVSGGQGPLENKEKNPLNLEQCKRAP